MSVARFCGQGNRAKDRGGRISGRRWPCRGLPVLGALHARTGLRDIAWDGEAGIPHSQIGTIHTASKYSPVEIADSVPSCVFEAMKKASFKVKRVKVKMDER